MLSWLTNSAKPSWWQRYNKQAGCNGWSEAATFWLLWSKASCGRHQLLPLAVISPLVVPLRAPLPIHHGGRQGVPAGPHISPASSFVPVTRPIVRKSATAVSSAQPVIRRTLLYCNRVRTLQIRWGCLPTPNYSGQVSHL